MYKDIDPHGGPAYRPRSSRFPILHSQLAFDPNRAYGTALWQPDVVGMIESGKERL